MKKAVAILSVGAFLVSMAYVTVSAQATRSVNEGVYTAEQAKRGEALYKEQCSACHGDNLEGSGPMPPLAGKDFLANWQGKTVGDLFEKTSTTMPATAPGSLPPDQPRSKARSSRCSRSRSTRQSRVSPREPGSSQSESNQVEGRRCRPPT
jgi:cytochrome c5